MITTINPATEDVLKTYEILSAQEVSGKVEHAHKAWREWQAVDYETRAACLRKVAELLRQQKKELCELIATEMGKPLVQAGGEVEKCAWACEYFADQAQEFLQPELIETNSRESYVQHEPLGVIFAIMPWNFPFWQVFRFAAPALMVGNATVVKHSPNTTGCVLKIEELFLQAGAPQGLFTALVIEVDQAKAVIEHPLVRAVTLTGSTQAGLAVAQQAAAVLKKVVLELGGSDPYIVLDDADIEQAADLCVRARMNNAGQTCIAAKRIFVHQKIKEPFIKHLTTLMQEFTMGDPLNPDINLGPLARKDLQQALHEQVKQSVEQGAQCIVGGKLPEQKGYFYPATVLTDVTPGMPVHDQEVFGPVAVVMDFDDEEQAIKSANNTHYGLGAAVFSKNITHAKKLASRLEVGNVAINTMVKSDPRLPFGGIKCSGYGRELGRWGLEAFTNIKSVVVL